RPRTECRGAIAPRPPRPSNYQKAARRRPSDSLSLQLAALARELHEVRTEVAIREVTISGGSAYESERVWDFGAVVRVTWSAVVVDVEGKADLARVLEHEVAVGVVEAGTTCAEDGDGDGAVAVVDNRVVHAAGGGDVGVGAAGLEVRGHDGATHALPEVRERRRAALVEHEVARD